MTQDQAEAALVRVGPFWDGIEGRVPVSPAAATLGFGFVMQRPMKSLCLLRPLLPSPIQWARCLGAFQAAMLYDTVRAGSARHARAGWVHRDDPTTPPPE
jgi:hypothetical protein